MRVQNNGKVAEVIAEFCLHLPPEFDLDDQLYKKHLTDVKKQHVHVDEVHRQAIAIGRAASEQYGVKATLPVDGATTITENPGPAQQWAVYAEKHAKDSVELHQKMQESMETLVAAHEQFLIHHGDTNAEQTEEVKRFMDKARKLIASRVAAAETSGRTYFSLTRGDITVAHAKEMRSLGEIQREQRKSRWWLLVGLLILAFLIVATRAHAQTPGVKVEVDNAGTRVGFWPAGIAKFNFSTNLTATFNAGTNAVDITATSGGSTPTGTGFSHVTTGSQDAAAKLVNLTASTDVASNQGTTTTVLHGNAAGQTSFATVVEADQTLADNTTNNASTSNHGYIKKLDNSASHFMDGTGNWSSANLATISTGTTGGATFTAAQTNYNGRLSFSYQSSFADGATVSPVTGHINAFACTTLVGSATVDTGDVTLSACVGSGASCTSTTTIKMNARNLTASLAGQNLSVNIGDAVAMKIVTPASWPTTTPSNVYLECKIVVGP